MPKSKPSSPSPRSAPQKGVEQVAALPVRRSADGGLEVLLVTSRETRRWIVPKGWPMKGRKDHRAAAIEAREEAGVTGKIGKTPIGYYTYDKRLSDGDVLPCRVTVYVLLARGQLDSWPEQDQRDVRWLSSEAAAIMVQEPELADLIRDIARLVDVVIPPIT